MGDSGLLDAFLMMISSEAQFDTTLTIHVLRMIGNCCAHIST